MRAFEAPCMQERQGASTHHLSVILFIEGCGGKTQNGLTQLVVRVAKFLAENERLLACGCLHHDFGTPLV